MKYSRLHSYRSYGDPPRSDSGGLEFGSVATVNSSIYIFIYIYLCMCVCILVKSKVFFIEFTVATLSNFSTLPTLRVRHII